MKAAADEGRTVIFVSYSMDAVNKLCSRAILFTQGKIEMDGGVEKVIMKYLGTEKSVS